MLFHYFIVSKFTFKSEFVNSSQIEFYHQKVIQKRIISV